MNPALPTFPLAEWLHEIVPNVFQTMVSLAAVPASGPTPPVTGERVVGALGIAGDFLLGTVYLQMTAPLAEDVTAALLDLEPGGKPAPAEVNDAIGEICNMIGGALKSIMSDHGNPCAISPPSIIRGSAFAIEPMPDAHVETISFDCLGHRLAVEIHLQTQDP